MAIERITAIERAIFMIYTRHHMNCKGTCGFCKQLREQGIDPRKEKEDEDEAQFAWDEANVLL